jgi:ABC-2 type transport system permease protein
MMLKGNGLVEAWPNLWPLILFLLVIATVSVLRCRQTLE